MDGHRAEGSPVRSRRRGAQLEGAIFDAVIDEVSVLGYAAASLEGIAARAGVGRMSLYRRWPGKPELVIAALKAKLPPVPDLHPELGLRDELVRILAAMFASPGQLPAFAVQLAATLASGPDDRHVAATVRDEIIAPRMQHLRDAFERASAVGEISAAADGELLARVGPAVIFQEAAMTGRTPLRCDIERLVDHVIMPAAQG